MAVPALFAFTIPVADPIEAMAGALLDQVPPEVALFNVEVFPRQALAVPVIAAGTAFTVTIRAVLQPMLTMYEIFAVPAAIPVTSPLEFTVAILVLELDQVPPPVALVRAVV